jgi:delta8-fatty-acid desaturase|mmetsp:Transcript_55959/g.87064  ORF Transcript_55959/g.87064 Transcript_55959/m.87064 type:complete len:933 (+) Transcript_55959:114-2912(+)
MAKAEGFSHFEESDADHRKSCCTVFSTIAVGACLIFVSGFVLDKMDEHMIIPLTGLGALSLVGLAGTCFVVCGVTMAQWGPTAVLGSKLIRRVTHTRENWETDMLRSFLEVGIWLGVIWYTYRQSGGGCFGLVTALTCSTLAGCLLAITGDMITGTLRNLDKKTRYEDVSDKFLCDSGSNLCITSGSLMLLALYGHGAMQIIYKHCHDFFVACVLAASAGLLLLMVSKLIQFWRPMRHVGYTMQARIMNTNENWKKYPVRSSIESTFWGGILIGTYTLDGNFSIAMQVSIFSGIVICLSSELLFNRLWDSEPQELTDQVAVAPVCIFAYGVFALLGIIFHQANDTFQAGLLSTFAGVGFTAIGQIALQFPVTAKMGAVINKRVINTPENWIKYPLRSFLELGVWIVATWGCYAATHSPYLSTGAGALTGIAAVLGNHQLGWDSHVEISSDSAVQKADAAKATTIEKEISEALPPSALPVAAACHEQRRPASKTSYSWSEVAKHSTRNDAWLVIKGIVYDVTKFAPDHPGGSIIYKYAGNDVTDQFAAFHVPRVEFRLRRLEIGYIDETGDDSEVVKPSAATLEYRALRDRLRKEGYFDSDLSYSAIKAVIFSALLLSSIMLVLFTPRRYFYLRIIVGALLLGIGWQQVAFLAHDAAHYAVQKPSSGGGLNWLAWFLASVLFGISTSMWNEEHSAHHAMTLRPREDPQFNYLPLWLISVKELAVPGYPKLDFVTRCLVRVQHFTFLPLVILVGRFNFYLISIAFAVKRLVLGPGRFQRMGGLTDVIGMMLFWAWLVALTSCIETWQDRLVFILVSHWSCGILHIQLLLSHLFTDTFTAEEERAEQFFSFQLKTTRNIDSEWYDHWFHGGLEYQIEHHLFPQLPRHNLAKVKPFVQDICKRHGIPYMTTSFTSASIHIMKDFRRLALAIMTLDQ